MNYKPGQEYQGHYDYFFDEKNVANGGNRYATVLMCERTWGARVAGGGPVPLASTAGSLMPWPCLMLLQT